MDLDLYFNLVNTFNDIRRNSRNHVQTFKKKKITPKVYNVFKNSVLKKFV